MKKCSLKFNESLYIKGIVIVYTISSLYLQKFNSILILLFCAVISYIYTKNIDLSIIVGLFITVILNYSKNQNSIFEGLTSEEPEKKPKVDLKKKGKKKEKKKKSKDRGNKRKLYRCRNKLFKSI